MPSTFLQAIGMGHRSEEEREARGRAVRTSRHSSRVTSSRHRSTKLRTKERNKSARSLMSATTGSESERKSRKRSDVRSNSGKKRTSKRDESEAERAARRERKEGKRRGRHESMTGETGGLEEGQPLPSMQDEVPTPAGLGISALCDIPQQQAVDVFQFQSDWSDDEDADKRTLRQPEFELNISGQYEDHPAEYESATDGHETDHHQAQNLSTDDFHVREHHSDIEPHIEDLHDIPSTTTTDEPSPQGEPELPPPAHCSLAPSVVDETDDVPTPMPKDFNFSSPIRTVSSGSSFVSTQFSEPHDDAETERSTSPETSFKSPSPLHASLPQDETPTQPGRKEEGQETSAAKLASQTLAAEHRQRTIRRRSSHRSRRPDLPRHYTSHQPYQNPWIPDPPYNNAQALSPIPPNNPAGHQLSPHIPGYPPAPVPSPMQMSPHIPQLPRDTAGNPPPLTGYAALATALSPPSSSSPNPASAVFQPQQTLSPLYRRFTSLNHRLLLRLQDELSELEEELAYLDGLDTASRTHPSSAPGRLVIRPASRREGAMAGSELEWRKTDTMNRISAKLHLYNETLASFQKTQNLQKPREEEVQQYHEYLATKRPLIEAESSFIDHTEDLVSLVSLAPRPIHHRPQDEEDIQRSRARPQRRLTATAHVDRDDKHTSSHRLHPLHHLHSSTKQQHQQTLFLAALFSVLLPIMVFHVVPNFRGRIVMAVLIGLGIMGLLAQSGATELLALGRREKRAIAGVWGGSMLLLALIV